MSPDDRGFSDRGPDDGFSDRGVDDRGLDRGADRGLEQQLTDAGRKARMTAAGANPDPIFAAELRERLVARLETQPPPLFPFGWARLAARVMPVSVAAVLFAAAVVGATQLNIGAPDPSDPATAATEQPDPTSGPKPSWFPEPSDDGQIIVPVASESPTAAPTAAPTAKPATASQAPKPTPPAAEPTVKPTPVPPPPSPVALSLSLKSCDGGVLLNWTKYPGADFNHYTTLRNTSSNIPLAYPPQGGAVDFGGTYTTDRFALSAVDATGAPFATYYYRTMAFTAGDAVVGASAVVSAQAKPTLALGALALSPDAGGTLFNWSPYGGNGACFTYYKLVASTTNPNPSYLNGDPYLWAGSTQGQGSVVLPDLVSGQTYYLRLQAIKSTQLGAFVAAQTGVTTYLAP